MYKQQIPGFDLLKFMLALLIVAIHTDFAVAVSVNNCLMRGGGNCEPAKFRRSWLFCYQ